MATKLTTDRSISRRIPLQKVKNTTPEIDLRRKLRRRGPGYRIELPLPGTTRRRCDIAFIGAKVAVFVDGCFWHSCPMHTTAPSRNREKEELLTGRCGCLSREIRASGKLSRLRDPVRSGTMSYLYGLEHASKDFTTAKSFGKNTFTNAFPLALTQYMAIERGLEIPVVRAEMGVNGRPMTKHVKTKWADIIHTDPQNAYFDFETPFEPYRQFTTATNPNPSDVVIRDNETREHLHPLELKLVVAPNADTADRAREEQACETVFRPPTVEQVAFSIAYGYTSTRRFEMQTLLRENLGLPNEYDWRSVPFMIKKLPAIVRATEAIIEAGIELQRPLIMVALWRSQGQKPLLDERNAFDTFVWTDLSFVQLFVQAVRASFLDSNSELAMMAPKKITRSARTLIWLVRSLWDYTTQFTLDFPRVQRDATYGSQSDKAGSFTNGARDLMMSDEFVYPRVGASEIERIFHERARDFLLPERRLDASFSLRFTIDKLQDGGDWKD